MVKRRVVVADGGVKAPGGHGKILVGLVGELIPFNVDVEFVGSIWTEHNLGQKRQVLGDVRGNEQIELAGLKRRMRRRRGVSAGSTSVIDYRKDQGIGDGSCDAEVEVEEASEAQRGAAGQLHRVAALVGLVFGV